MDAIDDRDAENHRLRAERDALAARNQALVLMMAELTKERDRLAFRLTASEETRDEYEAAWKRDDAEVVRLREECNALAARLKAVRTWCVAHSYVPCGSVDPTVYVSYAGVMEQLDGGVTDPDDCGG